MSIQRRGAEEKGANEERADFCRLLQNLVKWEGMAAGKSND
jgi:hypothetical protein